MKAFLIQGKQDVGKTTLCKAIDIWLIENEKYTRIFDSREKEYQEEDFIVVYQKDNHKMIINTWGDDKKSIEYFTEKYEEYKPFDTLITAIRPYDINRNLHTGIKRVFNKDVSEEIVIDLDELRNQYPNRERFAEEVLNKEFIPKFLNNLKTIEK